MRYAFEPEWRHRRRWLLPQRRQLDPVGPRRQPVVAGLLHWQLADLRHAGDGQQRRAAARHDLQPDGSRRARLLASADVLDLVLTDAAGDAMSPISVPNNSSLEGVQVFHQWAIWDPTVNSLSIVMSNGGVAKIGG